MRSVILCCAALLLMGVSSEAADKPAWAFPVTDKAQPVVAADTTMKTAPGSALQLTREQIDDLFNAPDWFPDMHPVMPAIVKTGNKPNGVRACGSCHLPTGTGHDESANVAGLPPAYFVAQMQDYKSGERKGSGSMLAIAKAITDDEIAAAANYFASVRPRPWVRVVEADAVPRTYVAAGNKRLRHPEGGEEPIGERIVQIPEDEEIVLNRDPRKGFVAYVPKGSIEKGRVVARSEAEPKHACNACHGETLHGAQDVPGLAGRNPNYIVRQLWSIQNGERTGPHTLQMQPVVTGLSVGDMLALAAYCASLAP
jgi:cytochrome c553